MGLSQPNTGTSGLLLERCKLTSKVMIVWLYRYEGCKRRGPEEEAEAIWVTDLIFNAQFRREGEY